MRKEDFFEILGELDDDIVKGAKTPVKMKTNWKTWGAIAACLAVVLMAAAVIPQAPPAGTGPREHESMIETRTLMIYYVSESGAIESKSVDVLCAPENIFSEWAALNNISDVTFVDCVYDNGGSVQIHGDLVEHTAGNHFTLDLTVSAEFSLYAESERGDLLIQSLRQTFCGYLTIDDFNLMIDT